MSASVVGELSFPEGGDESNARSEGEDNCPFSDSAWNHRTNCESGDNEEYRLNSVPLAFDYSGNINKNGLVFNNGLTQVPTMGGTVEFFEQYINEAEDTVVVLEDEGGSRKYIEQLHRFDETYMRKQYARVKQAERHYTGRYGSNYGVAMLTLTASNTADDGSFVPYLDHLEDLKNGYRRARNRLNKVLADCEEWDYVAIVEPHKSGYAHIHLGVFFAGTELETDDFRPVIRSHLSNCDRAGEEAHKVLGQKEYEFKKTANSVSRDSEKHELGCVSVEYDDDSKAGMGSYVGSYLAKELNRESDVTEAEAYLKRFYAGMWASGSQRFMTSQGLKQKTQDMRLKEADFEELGYQDAVNKLLREEYDAETVDFDGLDGSMLLDLTGKIKGASSIPKDVKKRLVESVRAKYRGSWELLGVAFKSELEYDWQEDGIKEDDICPVLDESSGGSRSLSLDEPWQTWDVVSY